MHFCIIVEGRDIEVKPSSLKGAEAESFFPNQDLTG